MTTIALFGAGGKMGCRLTANLKGSDFDVRHVEVGEAGRRRLKDEFGVDCVSGDEALAAAQAVILAVPDVLVGKVAAQIEPQLKPGVMVIVLDAAAPFAGHLPAREDLVYFVTHPCHPPIFNEETEMGAKQDYFGGVSAQQHIVCALMQGPEEAYSLGEKIARTIYAPVMRSHRVTVDEMALLEPVLSETIVASLLDVMREAMEEVIARGVQRDAARDFLLGHLNILGAVTFGEIDGVFSDACNKAIKFGRPMLMRDDWKRVFEPAEIAASIKRIT